MSLNLQALIDDVKAGRLSRRGFMRRLLLVGLSAPMATQLLTMGGVAHAQPKEDAYKPTKRGGGGLLKVLWWQAPTLLNPHFAIGTKDQDASRIFYQPLASWDVEGNLYPVLAAELPSKENGGLSEDGKSVTWKLRQDVKWHDGTPFTADDCVFNWQYAKDPATASVTIGLYQDVQVEKVDDHSVKVIFQQATPFWANAFVGNYGCLIPKHLFENYIGAKSRDAPTNLSPVGTGPYKFKEFRPGDLVSGTINNDYFEPNRPFFDEIQMKGGGDAASAARAVLQTGEFDYAWNLQVEDDVLSRMEKGGNGHVYTAESPAIEHIVVNFTDPNVEVDGQRSSLKTKHPVLSDPAVREALNYLIERDAVQKYIYGRGGVATANFVNVPKRFDSPNMHYEFSVEKAKSVLDQAGWKPGPDGIRVKDGKPIKLVFQTSINQPRQKTQQIIKQACQKAGIDLELKSVVASVFFSSDVANPDTYSKFYCDLEEYNTTSDTPDPAVWLRIFYSTEAAQKENKWQGRNISRWQSKEYDETWDKQQYELDPIKRAQLLIECNDLACRNHVVLPIVYRPIVAGISNKLRATPSGFESQIGSLPNWWKES
ncbi:MAG: peptide ABC transporter substrate-binding protein [Acetobacteraceae bacterium]|nr:peptide ABC transporter substrate-binding protein [Acetobacteraceae bacterium]